jgi:cell wall-associated NlpC family hydrolase
VKAWKVGVAAAAVLVAVPLALMVLLSAAVFSQPAMACAISPVSASPADGSWAAQGSWTGEQVGNAAVIVEVGVERGVPRWGWVIGVATAMQESGLRNLPHLGERNDHDSVGLFQQRPSQGWGSVVQLLDPGYAAGKFYERLLQVPGWQTMPLTDAAQAVQRSGYPDAYAKWTDDALGLVATLGDWAVGDCEASALDALPAGFTLPSNTPPAVATAISWALGQRGTPYSFGGSCTDPHSGDPATQCDCSSLMQQAYAAAGISIPRITTDQVRAGGAVADAGLLRPGDLLFIAGGLGTMSNPRHVGMFLGQGLIIHAPRTGDVVKITSLSSWLDEIAAIRRIAAWSPA